jgi:hypothetical protein
MQVRILFETIVRLTKQLYGKEPGVVNPLTCILGT